MMSFRQEGARSREGDDGMRPLRKKGMTEKAAALPYRLRKVICEHCDTAQGTLLHPYDGGGYTFVCLECGRRNFLSEEDVRGCGRILDATLPSL